MYVCIYINFFSQLTISGYLLIQDIRRKESFQGEKEREKEKGRKGADREGEGRKGGRKERRERRGGG